MEDQQSSDKPKPGFGQYMIKRLIIAALLIILVIWAFVSAPKAPAPKNDTAGGNANIVAEQPVATAHPAAPTETAPAPADDKVHVQANPNVMAHAGTADSPAAPSTQDAELAGSHPAPHPQPGHTATSTEEHGSTKPAPAAKALKQDSHGTHTAQMTPEPDQHEKTATPHEAAPKVDQTDLETSHGAPSTSRHENLPTGVAFVEAAIAPIDHELNSRFWGWRPNDIINFTDNANNFQLGALEVTRRTAVLLAERISRTGTTDAFNPHLENAMNWLMVKADRYWFPSPESKYKESIKELTAYKEELLNKRGSFYTRTDNLIPLLSSYENLLGSCDENLVKQKNEDGSKVSHFKADDYFYYAKGVASTMATILEAIHHDFHKTLESRHAVGLLHHALESCRQAAALDPLLITNGSLDGVLANHRANMAAPISHARFYIGQLVKTLST